MRPDDRFHPPDGLSLLLAWAVGGGCAYEVVALVSGGKLPTLSAMCRVIRRHPLGWLAIFLAVSWLGWHLLVEA